MARLLGAARFLLPVQKLRHLAALVLAFGCGAAHAIPIGNADTVFVEGREWVQPDLFLGMTWAGINSTCPGGVCGSGTLNGHDMDGWIWAGLEDMNQLFNYYIGSDVLGPGPGTYFGAPGDFTVYNAFVADGWRRTALVFGIQTVGRIADHTTSVPFLGNINVSLFGGSRGSRAFTNDVSSLYGYNDVGAWFYRADAPSAVPLPSSLWLLAAALFGWAGLRCPMASSPRIPAHDHN